jgi:protein-tyrosine phosphatase
MIEPPVPVASHDRHIALEGAVNFRDLGGYRTVEGRTVRWRSLFRADDLSRLSRSDRAVVRTLGIATVIDLRSRAEVEAERFPVEEIPVGFHHLPLIGKLPGFDEYRSGPGWFAGHYLDIARQSGDQIAQAVGIVAQPQSCPVIVHCAAGKDRTGVLVAVLLALLGVPDETIAEDYALSAKAMDAHLGRLLARLPEHEEEIRGVAATMLSATPANIRALLDGVRAEHGSVEGYVAAHGAAVNVVVALRERLLE